MRSIERQRDRKIPTGGWGSPPLFQSEGSHPDMITRLVFFLSTICCCAQSRARFHFILHCNKLGRREGMAKQGFEAKFSLSVDRSVSQIFNPIKVGLVAIPEPRLKDLQPSKSWACCNSGTLALNHYCNLNVNPNKFQTVCLDLPMN